MQEILIIGGGYGGVYAALRLLQNLPKGVARIRLISDRKYLEYTAALYRVVTGRTTAETCIPHTTIFQNLPMELLEDRIVHIDLSTQTLTGASDSRYHYDFLILALGSETTFFDIPGVREASFGMKNLTEALRLRRHLHKILQTHPSSHIVIVGGGATGVEIAGELAAIFASDIHIDLVEAMPRLLPSLPEDFAQRVTRRLRKLGVRLHLNSRVLEEKEGSLLLSTTSLPSNTVIWTAGVQANVLLRNTKGLEVDQKGRGVVDPFLHAKGHEHVFLLGDCAETPFSGMAQTAVYDGAYVALSLRRTLQNLPLIPYTPRSTAFAIPVGPHWAAVLWGPFRIYGRLGWWLRRFADLKVMMLYLPCWKALSAWYLGQKNME